MEKIERHKLIKSTYEYSNDFSLLEETIEKVKDILWFKKIIAFSWWWTWIKVPNTDLQDKVKKYSDELKCEIINDIMKRLKDYNIAILTWWTSWDVPKIATKLAREYNLPTIWVLPERWKKSSMWKEYLNAEIVVPPIFWESHYWDESSIYAKLLDWAFMVWWWAGTLIEFAHIMKINEWLNKYNKKLKKIVPITWIPWVAEAVSYIPWNEEIKSLTFPNRNIIEPKEAFEILKKDLDLDDILKEEY